MIASLKITSVSSFHLLRIKYYIIAVYVFFFNSSLCGNICVITMYLFISLSQVFVLIELVLSSGQHELRLNLTLVACMGQNPHF